MWCIRMSFMTPTQLLLPLVYPLPPRECGSENATEQQGTHALDCQRSHYRRLAYNLSRGDADRRICVSN
jgi:hypothetical protein